jgi:hypothetical protein
VTTPVTCCGLELRRESLRCVNPRNSRIVHEAARNGLTLRVEAVVSADTGALVSASWEGCAIVTVKWNGALGENHERRTIADAAGSTAQGCADTLAEMVRSVAAALAGVAG